MHRFKLERIKLDKIKPGGLKTFSIVFTACAFLALLSGCYPKYVEILDTSSKIERSCFSITPPQEGKWYEAGFSVAKCENEYRLVSGDGEDVYVIYLKSFLTSWNDKFNDQYIMDGVEKYIKSDKKKLLKKNKFGIEDLAYNMEVVSGVKDYCVKLHTQYSSTKPIWESDSGHTATFIRSTINPSDIYFYDYYEFFVIEGPYKMLIGRNAVRYTLGIYRVSTHREGEADLEAVADELLSNLEVTVDWKKIKAE